MGNPCLNRYVSVCTQNNSALMSRSWWYISCNITVSIIQYRLGFVFSKVHTILTRWIMYAENGVHFIATMVSRISHNNNLRCHKWHVVRMTVFCVEFCCTDIAIYINLYFLITNLVCGYFCRLAFSLLEFYVIPISKDVVLISFSVRTEATSRW